MPVYQYKCESCNLQISITETIKENNKTPLCVKCTKSMVRVWGLQTIIFKGTGWGKDA